MAVPVIKNLFKNLPAGINLIDCAPGTSCNVVNSLQYADCAILVTEPSSFGLHDLKMEVQDVNDLDVYDVNIMFIGLCKRSREADRCQDR